MKYFQQKYSDHASKNAMIRLASACQAQTLHVIDLPYRLSSWALDEPENIGCWVDEHGKLTVWVVMQTPFWVVDYVIRAEAEENLHQQVLAWADQRARALSGTPHGRPAWFINVFADQKERRHALEAAGYSDQAESGEDAWSKVWMRREGQSEIPGYAIPSGFSLRQLAGEHEVEAYVALHQETFKSKNMTTPWRARTLQQLDYKADLDIVAVDPSGRLAAFCIGWLSQGSGGELIGQIEPLGCHAAYRKYALGRLVLCEVLRRMQLQGVESIFVETDNYRNTAFRLYESVGFSVIRDVLVYRKNYTDEGG